MANFIDSNITKMIINMAKQERLDWFIKHNYMIQDDSAYWQLLAAIWIDSEACTPNLDKWIILFSSKRRNRHKLMKKKDREYWHSLPKTVQAFRAINDNEDIDKAISWSLDVNVCARLYPSKRIEVRYFPKKQIIAFFNRRREMEIIILNLDKGK